MDSLNNLHPHELREMAAKLVQLANQLESEAAVSQESANASPFQFGDRKMSTSSSLDYNLILRKAHGIYRFRQIRAKYFSGDLFGEPAWDMLLDLFVSRLRGQRISITSLCIASNVPSTTALRWLGVLKSQGLVERYDSEQDRRVSWLRLSDSALLAMLRLVEPHIDPGEEVTRQIDELQLRMNLDL